MKLFPFILARIGGLPIENLEQLSSRFLPNLELLFKKHDEVELLKRELIELIENSKKEIHCGFVLKNLAYLKFNLINNKRVKLSPKLEANLKENEKPFYRKIELHLNLLKQKIETLKKLEIDFETPYKQEIDRQRMLLQQLATNEILLNGLLMSSHTFLNQLQKYAQKPRSTFAKKEFQTERGLLQFLSRICTKTSPFSTFTTLSIFNLATGNDSKTIPKNGVRLNNHIFDICRDLLQNHPNFYRDLAVSLNPSLIKKSTGWVFLLNTRNVESIQKMEQSDLLEFISESIGVGEEIAFNNLANKVSDVVESDSEAIESYFLELVDFGFLEWRWPFSGLDPLWYKKLELLLSKYKEDSLLSKLAITLNLLDKNILRFSKADFKEKKQLQIASFEVTQKTTNLLFTELQNTGKEMVVDVSQLKHFKAKEFNLKLEKIFFEDVCSPFKSTFKNGEIGALIEELDELLDCLQPLYYNSKKNKMRQFFIEHYKKDASVNVYSFYKDYYKNEQRFEKQEEQKAVARRLAWQKEIIKHSKFKDGVLTVELDLLKTLKEDLTIRETDSILPSRGSFIQFFSEERVLKGFTETSFEGFGKMMGRFLYLFPDDITEKVNLWNKKLRGDDFWVENVDASIYNPNIHPSIIPFEIRIPGSQNNLSSEFQISATELEIVYNKLKQELELIHKPTDQIVYVFDMGFEAIESRSPFYQMLSTFNKPSLSQQILAEIVNHHFKIKQKDEISIQPRICVGKQLIIQRKRWFVPKEILPFKQNEELDSGYFIRLNRWIVKNGIPKKVFITLKPESASQGIRKTDDYKPQYIDFQSIVFVLLFSKLIKKVDLSLKIEEFLPYPTEPISTKKHATEYLVQWET